MYYELNYMLFYNAQTLLELVMPSKTHVLSLGIYCFVINLMASCATRPPTNEEILCNSPPPARILMSTYISKDEHFRTSVGDHFLIGRRSIKNLMNVGEHFGEIMFDIRVIYSRGSRMLAYEFIVCTEGKIIMDQCWRKRVFEFSFYKN